METIAAIATGAGKAGIGVIRVSGPAAIQIASSITAQTLHPRFAHYLPFLDAQQNAIDIGIAILFEAPNSYTGEHILELQGHGGPVVLDMLLSRVLECGARLARPGEFTERAFLNNKLDLAQAEAVADLIDSGSASAARASLRSMSGEFSLSVNAIQSELTSLRAWLEAALDFSEDDIDFMADPALEKRAIALIDNFQLLLRKAAQGKRLRDGFNVVIAGVTNVGKSSLLNTLSGEDSAIVTDIAGTTRDVLHEHIALDGVPMHLVDTAGLRETDDLVEKEGIHRARKAIENADHVLVLVDATRLELPHLEVPDNVRLSLMLNKQDLLDTGSSGSVGSLQQLQNELEVAALTECEKQLGIKPITVISSSVKTGSGIEELKQHLLDQAGYDANLEGAFIARRRHLDALESALDATQLALQRLREAQMPELAAEELRQAQLALDSVTGRFDSEDLLGEIFSSFCIGK